MQCGYGSQKYRQQNLYLQKWSAWFLSAHLWRNWIGGLAPKNCQALIVQPKQDRSTIPHTHTHANTTESQLAVSDMTMSRWKPTKSLIHTHTVSPKQYRSSLNHHAYTCIHHRIQLAVGDMTMSGWKQTISLIPTSYTYRWVGESGSTTHGHITDCKLLVCMC